LQNLSSIIHYLISFDISQPSQHRFVGSSEENHLPHFRKSDVIDDITVTSWVGDDVTWQFSWR